MSDWRPREHDHLVEPFLGGLGQRRRMPRLAARDLRLWVWIALCALAIGVRTWTLL